MPDRIIVYHSRLEQVMDEFWSETIMDHPEYIAIPAAAFLLFVIVCYWWQNRKMRRYSNSTSYSRRGRR